MSKINKKITLFSLLTCGLLGASGGGSSSSQINPGLLNPSVPDNSSSKMDPNLRDQALGIMSRKICPGSDLKTLRSEFKTARKRFNSLEIPSDLLPFLKAYKKAADEMPLIKAQLDEYTKYFRRQCIHISPQDISPQKAQSYMNYIMNSMNKYFLTKDIVLFILSKNSNTKIASLMNSFHSSWQNMNWNERRGGYDDNRNQYIQDHLLDILMALTSDNPRVAALELPPLDQIEDKETAIDKILDTLAPDLDQCDKNIENCFLTNLASNFINNNYYKYYKIKDLNLPPLDQIEDKERAIDQILEIVSPSSSESSINHYNKSVDQIYPNDLQLIWLIRRNRRNVKKFNDYLILFHNYEDAIARATSSQKAFLNQKKLKFCLTDFRGYSVFPDVLRIFNQFVDAKCRLELKPNLRVSSRGVNESIKS